MANVNSLYKDTRFVSPQWLLTFCDFMPVEGVSEGFFFKTNFVIFIDDQHFILLAITKCVQSDMWHFRRADSTIKKILLLGNFPIQGSNPPLLRCKQILHCWAIKEAPESRRDTHQIIEGKFKVWSFMLPTWTSLLPARTAINVSHMPDDVPC